MREGYWLSGVNVLTGCAMFVCLSVCRARRVERTSSIHDIAELPQRARAAVRVGEMTEFVVHTSGHGYYYACISVLSALVVN